MNHFSKNWLTKTNRHQGDFYTRRLLDKKQSTQKSLLQKKLYTRGNSNQQTLAPETFYNKQLFFCRLLITLQYVFFAWAVGILYIQWTEEYKFLIFPSQAHSGRRICEIFCAFWEII